MKKTQIIISVIVLILVAIVAFQTYKIYKIDKTLQNDQQYIQIGAQASVNTWNFIVQTNQQQTSQPTATSTSK